VPINAREASQLERGGDVNGLVGKAQAGTRRAAGRQVRELGVLQPEPGYFNHVQWVLVMVLD
jgi:hypothetical protein